MSAPHLRPIERVSLIPGTTPAQDFGCAGRMEWLPLDALMIDTRYQRPVLRRGEENIRRITQNFRWSCFAPLIVSPIGEGDFFAIVDGQHRAAAALAHGGIKELPCWIIDIDTRDQARAFAAVNAETTRMNTQTLWHARHMAGDLEAVEVFEALAIAGVDLPKYPVPKSKMVPRQTLAIGALVRLRKLYGCKLLTATLVALAAAFPDTPGAINALVLRCTGDFLASRWGAPFRGRPKDIAPTLRLVQFERNLDFERLASRMKAALSAPVREDGFIKAPTKAQLMRGRAR